MKPSTSRFFNVSVNTFGEISGMALPMALKRVLSFSESTHKINKDHFPENLDIILRTGQALTSVYFFYFLATVSCSFSIIVTFKVSSYGLRKLLFIRNKRVNFVLSE